MDKCQQDYDRELKRLDTCYYRTGDYKSHKGNFSFIANSQSTKKQSTIHNFRKSSKDTNSSCQLLKDLKQ